MPVPVYGGRKQCEYCDSHGSEMAMQTGKAVTYHCRAGLIDFSAPIIANGEIVGCIIGGQVLAEAPQEEIVRNYAEEAGLDFDACWEAIQKVPILPQEKIEASADFLYTIAGIISDLAYSKYQALLAGRELEQASSMKSDFLASMTHELRTPMNAVLGMTEMALREELPPTARNYILQIKSSGKILLNLINDVLDFSKIESGKMELVPVEYEMLSLYNDVAAIIETRLKDKRIELMMSMDPKLPCRLYGDNARVRQILINLANNAVKFTQKGMIQITMDYRILQENQIRIRVAVTDTGCGIKPEDQERIFESFQQVDSRRNRGAEGTGLGLAICKKLLALMDGEIQVSSVYEKGTTFTVEFNQQVIDWKPSIQVKEAQESMIALGYFRNRYLARQFFADMRRLQVLAIAMISPERIEWGLKAYEKECRGKKLVLFTDERDVDEELKKIPEQYPEISVVELVDFFSNQKTQSERWRVMRRPLSTNAIAMALNGKELVMQEEDMESDGIDFTAPEAKVLIVDDNAINLTVTEGLLEPLQMKITSITSGSEALDLIAHHAFDLIFMDHMMPEMDGIQTTRAIRRLYPQYKEVPIIALTANAVEGMREVFLSEGMNDFVAKPIEVRTLIQKVKQWLPPEKIVKNRETVAIRQHTKLNAAIEEKPSLTVGDLDTVAACKLLGSEELFRKILKEYYKSIPGKAKLIGQLKQQADWERYTIEVHALKSASRQIGANQLADLAAVLESAGQNKDLDVIRQQTDELLGKYTGYLEVLRPFCQEQEMEKEAVQRRPVTPEILQNLFADMLEAIENLDIDRMEAVETEMAQYEYSKEAEERFARLCEAIDIIDVDTCAELLQEWKTAIGQE